MITKPTPTFDPIVANSAAQSFASQTSDERRAHMRGFNFWHTADLATFRAASQSGDDGRADLPTSEVLIFSLLANRSPALLRSIFGHKGPIKCVTNGRQPLCAVAWDRGNGVQAWITDGRQRGGDSDQRGTENPGAIEAINRRVKQLVELARELASKDADAASKPEVLKIKTRNEAENKGKRGDEGWQWARKISLPLYVGGKVGDGASGFATDGLIDWNLSTSGKCEPVAIPFVAWVVFEPEDRDPGTFVTQLASIALKGAQIATPPTVQARQLRSLCGPRAPERAESEDDEAYARRVGNGLERRPDSSLDEYLAECGFGQGLPITFVAENYSISPAWAHSMLRILDLVPEVQQAIDANARGEDGLSLKQVITAGFFYPATGGPGEIRLPKPRDEQLRMLGELCGKRGNRSLSTAEEDASVSGGGGETSAERHEVSGTDSALARHRADEPRAPVGPDSPATAGDAPRSARLDGSLFLALRERQSLDLEMLTPKADGTLPDGSERTPEKRVLYCMHDAAYHVASYFAGDPAAFAQTDGESPIILEWRRQAKDACDEVLRARGLTIKVNAGAVSTGAPVLPVADRKPAEVEKTPRSADRLTPTTITVPAATDGEPAKVAAKTPKPKKQARRGPLKPAKSAKSAKSEKSEKVKEAKPVKPSKPEKAPKLPKPAKVAIDATTKKRGRPAKSKAAT